MKNKILLTLILGMFLIVSMSSISAWSSSYTQDDYCLDAYAEVEGHYPKCDGESYSREGEDYCFGSWYVDISHEGEKFYITYSHDYPDDHDFDEHGATSDFLEPIDDGKIYLDYNSNGNVPCFYLTAHDYDECCPYSGGCSQDAWGWAWTSHGYDCGTFSNLNEAECKDGTSDCVDGNEYRVCEKGVWENKGKVDGKCGYRDFDKYCGDGKCQSQYETYENCPKDCNKGLVDYFNDLISFVESIFGSFDTGSLKASSSSSGSGGSSSGGVR